MGRKMSRKESKLMEVRVKLKIKDVKIELSLDEVRELGRILESIVGRESPQYIPYYVKPLWRHWDVPYWDWGTTTTTDSAGTSSDDYPHTTSGGACGADKTTSTYSVSLKT